MHVIANATGTFIRNCYNVVVTVASAKFRAIDCTDCEFRVQPATTSTTTTPLAAMMFNVVSIGVS